MWDVQNVRVVNDGLSFILFYFILFFFILSQSSISFFFIFNISKEDKA